MLFDRRTTVAGLISAGTACGSLAATPSQGAAAPAFWTAGETSCFILESGQRRRGPHSIAIMRCRYASRHEEALASLAKSAGYKRMLSYRSSDSSKLRYSRMAIAYVMRQPDIDFSVMFFPEVARLAKDQSWQSLIGDEYSEFLRSIDPRPGKGQLAWKTGAPSRAPYAAVAETLLEPASRARVTYDVSLKSHLMQVSSLIAGALTSSLAGLEVHGTKAAIRTTLKRTCKVRELTPAVLNRTDKFQIHIATGGAAAAGSEATESAAANRE